jgi:hypothetical protein
MHIFIVNIIPRYTQSEILLYYVVFIFSNKMKIKNTTLVGAKSNRNSQKEAKSIHLPHKYTTAPFPV